MTLKTFKPYTKSTRGTVVLDKSNLWKGSPHKPLTKGQNFTGGRNNNGLSHQDILEVVQNINIELLIFTERKKIFLLQLRGLNMIQIEPLTLLC